MRVGSAPRVAVMIADYHIHMSLCRRAEGEPREYMERANGLGMSEMGCADRLPCFDGWRPGHEISDADLSLRLDERDSYVRTWRHAGGRPEPL